MNSDYISTEVSTEELSNTVEVLKNDKFIICKNNHFPTFYLICENTSSLTPEDKSNIEESLLLAVKISDHPSEELLTLAYTEDLKEYWYGLRNVNFHVALEFLGSCLKINTPAININADNELIRNLVHFCGARYYDLWIIIKESFWYIKQQCPKIPDSPQKLFFKIVADECEYPFENVILTDYVLMDMKRFAELSKKISQRFENKINYVEINKEKLSLLSSVILLISQSKKLAKNRLVTFHAERYNLATKHMVMVVHEMAVSRNSKGLMTPSWAWRNGNVNNNIRGRKPNS